MKNVIILFGKPGAGKGTRLSEFLEGKKGYSVLGVGNLLRKAKEEKTSLGKEAKKYMDAGQLLPDEIINKIVIEGIRSYEGTIIFDGYPRTQNQAKAMIRAGIIPERVVGVYLDDDILLERAKGRIVCSKCGEPYTTDAYKHPKVEGICDKCQSPLIRRADDDEKIVKERLKVYKEETEPVLEILLAAGAKVFVVNNNSKTRVEDFAKAMTKEIS